MGHSRSPRYEICSLLLTLHFLLCRRSESRPILNDDSRYQNPWVIFSGKLAFEPCVWAWCPHRYTLSFPVPCPLNSTQKWFRHSFDDSKTITAPISQPQGFSLENSLSSLVCGSLKICFVCLFHPVSEAEVTYQGWLAPSLCPCTQSPSMGFGKHLF